MAFVADAFLFVVLTGVYGYARTHGAWTENQDAHDIVAAMFGRRRNARFR